MSEFGYCFNLLVGGVIRSEFKQSDRSVLIGFSNRVRGPKRLATPKALGDSDNHMSCHGRKYGTGRTRFQLQSRTPDHCPTTVSVVEWIEMLLAIGEYPCSRAPGIHILKCAAASSPIFSAQRLAMQDVVASRAPLSSSSVEIWGAWLGQPSRLTGPPGWDSIRAEPFAQAHRSSVRRMSDGRKPGQALVRNGPERTEGLSNTFADTASMLCRDEEEVRQGGRS